MDFASSSNKNSNNCRSNQENEENSFELQLGYPIRGTQRSKLSSSVAAPSASSSSSSSTLEPLGLQNGSSSEDPPVPPGFEGSEISSQLVQPRELQLRPPTINDTQQTSESNTIWFCLISVPNEEGVSLPQLDKAYIRLRKKPGATSEPTVLTVKKYLARKFRLSDADIDLSCMGLSLWENSLGLTFVRDSIWHPRITGYFLDGCHDPEAVGPSGININLMRLNYTLSLDA